MKRATKIIGTVTVPEGYTARQNYEYAAWFRQHKLDAGTYPVLALAEPRSTYEEGAAWAEVPSTITAACLQSGFGGVGYGPDNAGKSEIGKRDVKHLELYRGRDNTTTEWILK